MKMKRILLGLATILAAGGAMAAYVVTPKVHEGRSGEAPELGRAGPFSIGTTPTTMGCMC